MNRVHAMALAGLYSIALLLAATTVVSCGGNDPGANPQDNAARPAQPDADNGAPASASDIVPADGPLIIARGQDFAPVPLQGGRHPASPVQPASRC
ncbi:MAG: hypothetical protein AB7K09_01860 [Planctomycetota bacterium]